MADTLDELLDKMENCGQSEGRALAECIKDGIHDLPTDEKLDMAKAMAAEFLGFSSALIQDLSKIT